jgi:hypothetical protein
MGDAFMLGQLVGLGLVTYIIWLIIKWISKKRDIMNKKEDSACRNNPITREGFINKRINK